MPYISILIISYNTSDPLIQCLGHLRQQTFNNFELILIDNGSQNPLPLDFHESWPNLRIRVEYFKTNKGFAFANNYGIHLAKGDWIATLNPDAFPEPDWLEQLVKATSLYPDAFFASRQLQANSPHLLDGEGDVYHVSGLAWRRNYGLPATPKISPEPVFSACAAAALYPRQALLEVGGFDESFFAYHEDLDLGFRLRLKGLQCYYIPQATVHHIGSASTGKSSDFAIYHGHRNLVWTFFKDMPEPLLRRYFALHLLLNVFSVLFFSLNGRANTILKAKMDAFKGLSPILAKRKSIQSEIRVSPEDILQLMERDLLAPIKRKVMMRSLQ
ncbi:MAG: glycosyltransferase family 2 protein [Nitrososphaerota archaeon]